MFSPKFEEDLLSRRQGDSVREKHHEGEEDDRRRRVGPGQSSRSGRAGAHQTVTGRTGVRTEHQVHIENHVRAERQGQRLAVDGRTVGDDQLHELLRRRVAQPTVHTDRRALFQKVNILKRVTIDCKSYVIVVDKCTNLRISMLYE